MERRPRLTVRMITAQLSAPRTDPGTIHQPGGMLLLSSCIGYPSSQEKNDQREAHVPDCSGPALFRAGPARTSYRISSTAVVTVTGWCALLSHKALDRHWQVFEAVKKDPKRLEFSVRSGCPAGIYPSWIAKGKMLRTGEL